MNILWQNEHYPDVIKGGGGAVNTRYIVSSLQRLGHRAVVLARGPNDRAPYQEEIDSVTIQRMAPPKLPNTFWPLWPLLEPRYVAKALGKLVEPFEAYVGIDAWFALSVKRMFPRRRLVYRVEGSQKSHDAAVSAIRDSKRDSAIGRKQRYIERFVSVENELVEQQAWKVCDAIVVKSHFMKGELQKLYKAPSEKIHVIPNGVDYERFAMATATGEALERLGNRNRRKAVILFCGRLVEMKNVSFLLHAFAMMERKEQAVLAILGEGEKRRNLEDEAALLGLGGGVRFLGHTNQIEEYLAASDIFVLPSTYEPFGNALVEAMAAGLPCIALRPDGSKIRTASAEIISEGSTGYLVNPADPADLATRLDSLVAGAEVRKKIGAEAQDSCKRKYNWLHCAAQYVSLLDREAALQN